MYRMFAKQALDEIEEWRHQATSPEHQLDWRWLGRFRELVAYDSYGWLAHAGPFTEGEQQQWDQLFLPHVDEAAWEQLATLMVQSRKRELKAAIAEQCEPRLRYPAIEIEEVRRRIAGLLQLDAEISQQEPNAIVRRLYHGAIEDEVGYLRLIEATYEGNTDTYWECNLRILTLPTTEEMEYALIPIKRMVLQGLKRPETREVAQRLSEFMQIRLHPLYSMPCSIDCFGTLTRMSRRHGNKHRSMRCTSVFARFAAFLILSERASVTFKMRYICMAHR
jgi:hypothetical protein